jgi:DNA-directed RNA polymerase specialized sigma24 family protein
VLEKAAVADPFALEHQALMLKHARTHVRSNGEKIAAEDVAREMELIVAQLRAKGELQPSALECADSFVRHIVLHAARRAKRRRTIIEQIAAGDDLGAVADDLRELDSDLPAAPSPPDGQATAARALLDTLKDSLSAHDALVFALLMEDNGTIEETALAIGVAPGEVDEAFRRILTAAEKLHIEGDIERRERPRS